MFAVFMDVTARKQAEEARETLVGEMSHRVKNLFAIASALTTIAARLGGNGERDGAGPDPAAGRPWPGA